MSHKIRNKKGDFGTCASEKASPGERRANHRTRMIHGDFRSRRWDYSHHIVPPITSSAAFRLDSVQRGAQGFAEFAHDTDKPRDPIYIYDRLEEPTRGMLEDNLALAEGGESALCFSSGMAAISAAVCSLVSAGDHIVTHDILYGCTYSLFTTALPRFGVDFSFVDMTHVEALKSAIKPRTRIVYFETPVNPDLTMDEAAKGVVEALRPYLEGLYREHAKALA